jgi:hypothetical protein
MVIGRYERTSGLYEPGIDEMDSSFKTGSLAGVNVGFIPMENMDLFLSALVGTLDDHVPSGEALEITAARIFVCGHNG